MTANLVVQFELVCWNACFSGTFSSYQFSNEINKGKEFFEKIHFLFLWCLEGAVFSFVVFGGFWFILFGLVLEGLRWGEVARRATPHHLALFCFFFFFWGGGSLFWVLFVGKEPQKDIFVQYQRVFGKHIQRSSRGYRKHVRAFRRSLAKVNPVLANPPVFLQTSVCLLNIQCVQRPLPASDCRSRPPSPTQHWLSMLHCHDFVGLIIFEVRSLAAWQVPSPPTSVQTLAQYKEGHARTHM